MIPIELQVEPRSALGVMPDHVLRDHAQPAVESFFALPLESLDRLVRLEKCLLDDLLGLDGRPYPLAHARPDLILEPGAQRADELLERLPVACSRTLREFLCAICF